MSYGKGVRAIILGMSMGVAGTAAFTGCEAIDKYVPKSVQNMAMDALGVKLDFRISGAPTDEVKALIFYLDRTDRMLTVLREQGEALTKEYVKTFDLKSEALTDQNMDALSDEIASIDPAQMTPLQKQWVEANLPAIRAWDLAIDKAISTGVSLGMGVADLSMNPPSGIDVGLIEDAVEGGKTLKSALDQVGPVVTTAKAVRTSADDLAKATGVTPPTKEEEEMIAKELMAKGLPGDETIEFGDA